MTRVVATIVLFSALLVPYAASAFTTRTHIVIANRMREALIASGDNSIPLRAGTRSVILPQEDADAIRMQAAAFRAGAIGPDNVVFPGLTDGTHAVGLDPFRQCELLHREALTQAERAYALGCFVHGASDAVAHHFVNYFTGETFTLNPITSSRLPSYSNAIRHILMESLVQDGAYRDEPATLTGTSLDHTIPQGFILRAYFSEASPIWQLMSQHARARFEATRMAMPGATLPQIVAAAGLGPVEQVMLTPVYVRHIDASRVAMRTFVEREIADMQNPSSTRGAQLRVRAGTDGRLGTADDQTACTTSCAATYARYYVFVRLLLPRMDAMGRPLPSAFDKVSDQLGADLTQFLPALVQSIQNISNEFNRPLTGANSDFAIDPVRVPILMAPMRDWATRITTLDLETVGRAVAPEWYTSVSDFLASLGIRVSIPDLLRLVFQPVIDQVRRTIEERVTAVAQAQLEQLIREYRAVVATGRPEYTMRLVAAAPAGLGATALDRFFDSGLYAHAFNLSAATLAQHDLVLPIGDSIASGPASFDASFTPAWTQAGLCDYLREHVFPLGIDVRGSLSVRTDRVYVANMLEDSPVECHDGSLTRFGMGSMATCRHTLLPDLVLMAMPRGSWSRAYPPDFGAATPGCLRLTVPGLPDPPPLPPPDAGTPVVDASTPPPPDAQIADAGTPDDAAIGMTPSGCGCRVPRSDSRRPSSALLVLASALLLSLARARRRPRRASPARLGALVLGVLASACSTGTMDVDTGAETAIAMDVVAETAAEDVSDTPTIDAPQIDVMDVRPDVPIDVPPDVPDLRRRLLDALGGSTTTVWNGMATRVEGTASISRLYEMHFRPASLEWVEVRNPWGPARRRRRRTLAPMRDGRTMQTVAENPSGWPADATLRNGTIEMWTFEITATTPRRLRISNALSETEEFVEGAVPRPTSGLTVEARTFASGGNVDNSFCGKGSFSDVSDLERRVLLEFARGRSSEVATAYDYAAGVQLRPWVDTTGANRFAVSDLNGFDRLGRTTVTETYNFIARYIGTVAHPGGTFSMRERNDDIAHALWGFAGTGVSSLNPSDLFLEVHGHTGTDATVDEPSRTFASGNLPVEILLLRCATAIEPVHVEVRFGTGAWQLASDVSTAPLINDTLFPPPL